MTKTLGATRVAAPAAVRATRPGWRDPRLWVGVAIVAICVVAGARLLASADDTIQVWAVRSDHAAGSVIGPGDLVSHRVRFTDGSDLRDYVTVGDPLPGRLTLVRDVDAGELLPRGAVADDRPSGLAQLPVSVAPAGVPAGLRAGALVDVYLVGRAPIAGQARRAPLDPVLDPVLAAVRVVDVGADDLSGDVTVTLAVPSRGVSAYFARLAGLDDPAVTIVGRM